MTKVSVIIPIYNVEKYLNECIESILQQTLSDLELILINDGSSDNSSKICEDYVKKDKRIKYISQENQGVSRARNEGLKIATGEYVFVMDSDDTIEKNFLDNAYKNAIKNNSDIVVLGQYYSNRLPYPPALPTMAMFFKREFFVNSNIFYPIGIQPAEDWLFSFQLIAKTCANKISCEKNAIYNYRIHDTQNHVQINQNCNYVLTQIPKWFEVLESFYNENNLWESKSKHLLKFIEHEPFNFRFCTMPFNQTQRERLYVIMHNFIEKYNLKKYLDNSFSKYFIIFVNSKNLRDYYRKIKQIKIIEALFSIQHFNNEKIIIRFLGIKITLKIKGS